MEVEAWLARGEGVVTCWAVSVVMETIEGVGVGGTDSGGHARR